MREKTIYVIERPFGCDSLSFITTKAKIKRDFIKMPDEIRWDFCNSHKEWIYCREEEGFYTVIQDNGYIRSDKVFTPKQYGNLLGIKIPADISLEEFDKTVADKYCLWNYPLAEYQHIVDNDLQTVVVKFDDDEYRFVEANDLVLKNLV